MAPVRRLNTNDALLGSCVLALAAGIFLADLWTPPSVVTAVLYAAPVFLSLSMSHRAIPIATAAVCTALTVLASFFSSLSAGPEIDLVNRGIAIVVLWATLWLGLREQQSAELLRKKERDLSDFIEHAAVGMYWVGPDGRIMWVNQAEADLLGYAPGEMIGRHIAEFHADRAAIDDILERLSRGETLRNYEARLRGKDGSIKYVLIDANVRWENSAFSHTRCFARDITEATKAEQALVLKALDALEAESVERKRVEERRRVSEERFRLIAQATHDAVWDWDLNTNEVWWGDGLHRLFGHQADHVDSKLDWWIDHVHPEDRNAVLAGVFASLERKESSWSGEYRFQRADGSYAHVLDRARVIFDGHGAPVRMIGAITDITLWKQMERHLRESEDQHRRLFEHSPYPMWVVDLETLKFLAVNDAAVRHYGYSREEFLRMTVMDIRPPEDIPLFLGSLSANRNIASGTNIGVWRHRKKDGTLIDVEISYHNTVFAGRPARLTLVNDVTERRRAEDTTRAFLRISEKLNATLDADRLMDELVVEAIALVNAEGGCAGLRTPEGMECRRYFHRGEAFPIEYRWPAGRGLPGWVLKHKAPYVTNDAATDPQIIPELRKRLGVKSAISVPILDSKEEVIGFFNIHNKRDGSEFTLSDQAKLVAVAQAASVAVQNALAYQKLQQADLIQTHLLNRIISVQEDERRRIARELHDETAQSLTSLLVGLRALEDAETRESVQAKAVDLRRLTSHTLAEIQRLARGLRPLALDDLGLEEAVRRHADEYAAAYGITVDVHVSGINGRRLPSPVETALYRITQEALTNAAKHAAPNTISVVVRREPSLVRLVVEDDGRGFNTGRLLNKAKTFRHLGLHGMRERAALLGGSVSIESAPGKGTTVSVTIPLPEELAA
ncbi:MAG: hypothetical protein KatS3mg082_1060 [Nitrospiraceae bacterium]|nr:MAG: hypothetical protein KatS3mg082_1060 [Nitrospiraceae bacterium]